jgi:hypothetical protein
MKTSKDLKPGDKVVVNGFRRSHTAVVEKVGRINIYLVGPKIAYDVNTGRAKDGYSSSWIETEEQHSFNQQVTAARAALSAFGVDVHRTVPGEKVLAIFAALQPHLEAK